MKTRHQVAAYMGLLGMTTLIAILVSIRDRLIAIGPWVLGVLLALCSLVILYYLHRLYVLFRADRLRLIERVYEVEGKRQALTIEQERWEVERASLLLGQHLQSARIYPDAKGYMPTLINVAPEGDYQYIHLPHPAHQTRLHGGQQPMLPAQAESRQQQEGLPTNVRYEDIKHLIPQGHVLVGIGLEGVETKPQAVGACLWIVGLSGTGKTSTTVLRVEERKQAGHSFLGADPHWFKDDSLFHAVFETLDGQPGPYADCFLMPMAKTPEEMLAVLNAFLAEFRARKAGQRQKPWHKITLLVDEVGSSMDKATATTPEEKAIIELLPSIARICGQEARNFNMGGIFISQQATGVAWLRKVALMVIVHQLHQESEKKLATNNDPKVMEEMKYWPIGRTYTFGVGFGQEGPRTVQQPYFKPTVVESTAVVDEGQDEEMEPLAPNPLRSQRDVYGTPGTPRYVEAEAETGDDWDAPNGAFRDDSGAFFGVPSNVRTFPFSPVQPPAEGPDATSEERSKAYRMTEAEIGQFLAAYRVAGSIDKALAATGDGKGTRYRQHAREILAAHNARQA